MRRSSAIAAQIPRWRPDYRLISFIVAFGLAALCSWKLFEEDFYWQLRAGDEILRTFAIPKVDTWSFTEFGKPFLNYEWLWCVLMRIVYFFGKEPLAVVLRTVIVFFWIVEQARIAAISGRGRGRWLGIVLIAPLIYMGARGRLQLRPDFLCLVLYTSLIRIFCAAELSASRLRVVFVLLLLWSNLQSGTVLFGCFAACAFVAGSPGWTIRRRAAWCAALGATSFLHPFAWDLLPEMFRTMTMDISQVYNADWRPLSLDLLDVPAHGWSILLAVLVGMLGWWSLIDGAFRKARFPGGYGDTRVVFAAGAVLTALAVYKTRFLPFQNLFFLPLIVLALDRWYENKAKKTAASAIAAVAMAIFWLWILPADAFRYAHRLGFAIDTMQYPVQAFQFIKDTKPAGKLFADFTGGTYQLWALPEYPVYVDQREILFTDLKAETAPAFHDPEQMRLWTDRFGIDVMVLHVPAISGSPGGHVTDSQRAILPADQWALVHFDNSYVVYLRRTPANSETIARYEYKGM